MCFLPKLEGCWQSIDGTRPGANDEGRRCSYHFGLRRAVLNSRIVIHRSPLVILKGHLLIEEQIKLIISERVKKPEALSDARLTYYEYICIAEAFLPENKDIWKPVKKLNNIRNKLAHNAEHGGLDDQIDDFVSSVQWFNHSVEDRKEQIEFKLWALFEAVSSLVERPTATVLDSHFPDRPEFVK